MGSVGGCGVRYPRSWWGGKKGNIMIVRHKGCMCGDWHGEGEMGCSMGLGSKAESR